MVLFYFCSHQSHPYSIHIITQKIKYIINVFENFNFIFIYQKNPQKGILKTKIFLYCKNHFKAICLNYNLCFKHSSKLVINSAYTCFSSY